MMFALWKEGWGIRQSNGMLRFLYTKCSEHGFRGRKFCGRHVNMPPTTVSLFRCALPPPLQNATHFIESTAAEVALLRAHAQQWKEWTGMETATSIFATAAEAAALTNCQHVRSLARCLAVGKLQNCQKESRRPTTTPSACRLRESPQQPTASKVDIIPHDTWHALCRKEGRTFAGWGCGPNNITGYKKCARKAGRKNAMVVICETPLGELSDIVPLLLSRPQYTV